MPTNSAETPISLDGYRIQVLEKLKALRDPNRAPDLLAEADLMLKASGLSYAAQRLFWETLHGDLDGLTEDCTPLLGKDVATALRAIIAVARADIARYLARVSR